MEMDLPAISPAWLAWLADFERVSRRIAETLTVSCDDDNAAERQSLRFALYARALTLVRTCRLLAEGDKLLDFRIHTRGVLECAMHLEALLNDPGHLDAWKKDDEASRRSRARAFVKRRPQLSPEDRNLLNEFIRDKRSTKRLNASDLPETRLSMFPHEFREISADAAHVSFSSLARHVRPGRDGVNQLIIDPALSAEELDHTMRVLALACLICTWLLIRGCPDIRLDLAELEDLTARFNELQGRGSAGEAC
jgi:hypothetical protein